MSSNEVQKIPSNSNQAPEVKHHVKHDGRGLRFILILFRMHCSIIPRATPVALFSSFLTIILMVVRTYELVPVAWLPILHHPIAVQMLGIVLGYAVVLRANVALNRYFDAMSNIQFFGSKWVDAFTQLCGFLRSSAWLHEEEGRPHEVEELQELNTKLIHYFSILHALAINSLQVTQLDLDEGEEFFSRISYLPTPSIDYREPDENDGLRKSFGHAHHAMLHGDATSQEEEGTSTSGLKRLSIMGSVTPDERRMLMKSESKVDLVHSWIIESIAKGSLTRKILTEPPILSRVYQELSNGMLGFNQAYKIALLQFPFAFAQMLTLFLLVFVLACPVAIYAFTGGEFLTPALTFFTILGFWGIHEIAIEIENPYGTDSNNLPLKPLHDAVCEGLFEVVVARLPQINA